MTEPGQTTEQMPAARPSPSHSYPILLVLSLLGVFFLYQIGGGLLTYLFAGAMSVTEENVGSFRVVTIVSQLIFILLPTILIVRRSGASLKDVFPLRRPGIFEFATSVLAMLALQRVLDALMYLQRQIPIPDVVESLLGPIKEMLKQMMALLVRTDSTQEFLLVLTVVAIVPAIVEEAFFRGLIQHIVGKIWNPAWGIVGSGVIFGLFHMNPFDVLGLMGLGLFLAYTRHRSGTMIVPVALHFINNALAIVMLEISGGGNEEMLFEPADGDSSMLLVLGQGVLFAFFFWILIRSYGRLASNAQYEGQSA